MQTIHQQQVEEFHHVIGIETPIQPIIPSEAVRLSRAKLLMEETLETIEALGIDLFIQLEEKVSVSVSLPQLNFDISNDRECDIIEVADGCADVSVIATGTLSVFGIQDYELQNEVNMNNLAKKGGYMNENDKWVKPEGHKPPNVLKILEDQGYGKKEEEEKN